MLLGFSQFRRIVGTDFFAIHPSPSDSRAMGGGQKVQVDSFSRLDDGSQQHSFALLFSKGSQQRVHRKCRYRDITIRAMSHTHFGEEQTKVMGDLGDGSHGRLAPGPRASLLQGNRGRQTRHRIDIGTGHDGQKLPRIRGKGFQKAALPLRKHHIENERAFARSAWPGDHHEALMRYLAR